MRAWATTAAALLAGVWVGGCRVKTVTPAPGMMPAAGMLRRCERIPLSMHLQLRRYTLLRAKVWADGSTEPFEWRLSSADPGSTGGISNSVSYTHLRAHET